MSREALKGALVRLHDNGLRSGLAEAEAEALAAAISAGTSLSDAGARAGLDPTLIAVLQEANVADVPAALAEQARIGAGLAADARRLQAAGTYPLVLAAAVSAAGAVVGMVLSPALSGLVDAPASTNSLFVAVGISATLLVGLSLLVLSRARIPGLSGGWSALHQATFFDSLNALVHAGADLPDALRGASRWCDATQQAAATRFVQGLTANTPTDAAPLMYALESAMLFGAAQSGTVSQTTAALAAQHRVRLTRLLPDAILRIQVAALLLAGIAVLSVGIAFFTVYADALAQ